MKNQKQLLYKYYEMLLMIKHYCDNAEPITPQHITRAFKTNDSIFTIMMRKGYITQLTTGRKKIFKWNKDEITEALLYEFYNDVLNYQREYLEKKKQSKRLAMDSKVQANLNRFENYESEEKKKQRRKITILWGLITF